MDRDLARLASNERCFFSRYADDLTFSTDRTGFPTNLAQLEATKAVVGPRLADIVTSSGFEINDEKTRLVRRWQRQRVTGLVINKQLNVPRDYVREVRTLLYIWERYGIPEAMASLDRARGSANRPPRMRPLDFSASMQGKIQYIGSIKGWHDPVYRALADRLALLDSTFAPIRRKHEPSPSGLRSRFLKQLRVCTEGVTDIKHLEAAMSYFRARDEYRELSLSFDRDSAFDSESALARHAQFIAAAKPASPTVCLFDRDNLDLIRKLSLKEQDWRNLGNGAAVAALVAPDFRKARMCIELLYSDEDLLARDSDGRRIYRREEFDERSGQHLTEQCNTRNIREKALIREDVYAFGSSDSIALTKSRFASLVAQRTAPFVFDFEGFRPTIEMLLEVALEIGPEVAKG